MGFEKIGDKDDKKAMTPGYSLYRQTETRELFYRFTCSSSRQGSGGKKKVVRRERADLITRFWEALLPPNNMQNTTRIRAGRYRTAECNMKVPEEIVLQAAKTGRGVDKVFHLDGSLYVTEEMLRELQNQQHFEVLRKKERKKSVHQIKKTCYCRS